LWGREKYLEPEEMRDPVHGLIEFNTEEMGIVICMPALSDRVKNVLELWMK